MNTAGLFSDEAVLAAIREELISLGCIQDTDEIRSSDSLYHDLTVDSLELVELVMNLEKHFNVSVNDVDIDYFFDGPQHGALRVEHMVHLLMGHRPEDFKELVTSVKIPDEQAVFAS